METKKNENKDKLIANLGRVVTESTSAFMVWLAPVVREVGHGTLTFEYQVRKEMTNPLGTMHGGVMAAIMDDLIGATIISLGREYYYATINNAMDYLAPAKEGDILTGKTEVIRAGRQVINVQFELWDLSKKRLLLRGYSNVLKTELKM